MARGTGFVVPGTIGPPGYNVVDPNVHFHPEEVEEIRNMTYHIGQGMYEIGNQYMIASPQPQYMLSGVGYNIGQEAVPQNALAVQMMPTPTIVRKQDPREARTQYIGCNTLAAVPVGAAGQAIASPQKIFKAERFVIPPTVAPDFLVNSILIGVQNQSPAVTAVPAEAFLVDTMYSNVDFDTCQISQQITVNVTNNGGAPRQFLSAFYGKVLQ